MNRQNSILLFIKYPVPGKVKTRLTPFLTNQQATDLYKNMAEQTLKTLKDAKSNFTICYDPSTPLKLYREWLGEKLKFQPQRGCDLGTKMKNAFTDGFKRDFSRILLIGSDIPGVTPVLLKRAFKNLEKNDAVLGPAEDGGYYLIGFNKNKFLPEVFESIPWSTSAVLKDTLRVLMKRDYKVRLAPKLTDIDRAEDIVKAGYKIPGAEKIVQHVKIQFHRNFQKQIHG